VEWRSSFGRLLVPVLDRAIVGDQVIVSGCSGDWSLCLLVFTYVLCLLVLT
jgi:hypothetical protein